MRKFTVFENKELVGTFNVLEFGFGADSIDMWFKSAGERKKLEFRFKNKLKIFDGVFKRLPKTDAKLFFKG